MTEDAEDAVQEALWAATRAIKTFRGSASAVASWLFTIVRHECFHRLEKLRGRREIGIDGEVIEGALSDASLDESLALKQRADRLAAALSGLEQIHREVIVLRDIEGLSAPEAATRLGITVDALKSRLHRARVSLRDRLTGSATEALTTDAEATRFGLDYLRHARFKSILPDVQTYGSGLSTMHHRHRTLRGNAVTGYSTEEVQFCIDFAIEAALRFQGLQAELDHPVGT